MGASFKKIYFEQSGSSIKCVSIPPYLKYSLGHKTPTLLLNVSNHRWPTNHRSICYITTLSPILSLPRPGPLKPRSLYAREPPITHGSNRFSVASKQSGRRDTGYAYWVHYESERGQHGPLLSQTALLPIKSTKKAFSSGVYLPRASSPLATKGVVWATHQLLFEKKGHAVSSGTLAALPKPSYAPVRRPSTPSKISTAVHSV